MKEFEPITPNGFKKANPHTTTLVIENVPSEIGYELVTEAINASGKFDKDELMQKVSQRMSDDQDYTVLSKEELDAILHLFVRTTIEMDYEERFYNTESNNEEFGKQEPEEKEDIDEFGRTPYVRRIIEEVKEEMRQAHNKEQEELSTTSAFHM